VRRRGLRGLARTQTVMWATLVLQFVTYYLDTVAQIIYVEQYFGELIPKSPICQWQWLLVTWLISIPVMQIPTLHESRYISSVAMAWVCGNVLCIAYEVTPSALRLSLFLASLRFHATYSRSRPSAAAFVCRRPLSVELPCGGWGGARLSPPPSWTFARPLTHVVCRVGWWWLRSRRFGWCSRGAAIPVQVSRPPTRCGC
jgi:hypothetical protein